MSQQVYRGNLSASSFPFVAENEGRTVIVPRYDNTYVPQVASAADSDKDRGIPQVYYMHNVIPTAQGFKSIGYMQRVRNVSSGFIGLVKVRDSDNSDALLGFTAAGAFWVLPSGFTEWTFVANTGVANPIVTAAFVSGITYIYIAGLGCYEFNFTTGALTPVVLAGLVAADILGIVGVAGYLLAWSRDAIAWSSTVDPTDFVPSIITGAGGGQVEGARGPLTVVSQMPFGFIVYTSVNAVSGTYSGNSRFPFNFREIINSGGTTNSNYIASDANTGNNITYTSSGLQTVSINGTQALLPEVTDFISGKYFEDFDEESLSFVRTFLTDPMTKQIQVISDRYLVISYGITSLTHALVYDLSTKRFGKLKVPHVYCFEFPPLVAGAETPRESVAFLKDDGTIVIAQFGVDIQQGSGVMILGKFQFIRDRLLTMESIDLDNIRPWSEFDLYDMVSVDGNNTTNIKCVEKYKKNLTRTYGVRATGINHSLLLVGAFSMVSFVLHFHINGRR
jgi:hypothetical protein